MIGPEVSSAFWFLAAVQLVGLASAWLARLSEGSCHQTDCQCLFLGCLGMVGVATVTALWMGPGWWLGSGATLSVMVVTATCDFRRPAQRATGR